MNRRHFLMSSAGVLAAARRAMPSPNDTVRVACVGLRGRGKDHLKAYGRIANVEVAALCDIDESVLNKAASQFEKRPATYSDLRKLLEDKSIDAISIATPNHSHTLQTIWACQAGKDVYVEKPCSHNMFEAKQIVAAARKYNRLVQQGSQSRSSPALQEAVQSMREGLLGEVYMARGLCFKWRDTIGHTPVEPVPPGVDYDLWLGPAPQHAFTKNRFHYNWHWFWDYGNGDLGNQGIHELDIARWGLGVTYPDQGDRDRRPLHVRRRSGNAQHLHCRLRIQRWRQEEDDGVRSPPLDEQSRSRHRRGAIEEREVRSEHDRQLVLRIQRLHGDRRLYQIQNLARQRAGAGTDKHRGRESLREFISAVRSRKRADLNAEIEEGAISTTLIHLANISYRLGRTLNFDAASYTCKGDPEANAMFTREYRKPFVVPKFP